jgi:hypothetical protein
MCLNDVLVLDLGPYTAGANVNPTLNAYTTISGTILTIAPTLPSHVGSSVIKVAIVKLIYGSVYSFTITVLSSILYFSPSLTDQVVSKSVSGTYTLPGITNTAGLTVTITETIPASFITYNGGTKVFSFNPTTAADLGVWNVILDLVDTASNSASYSFSVTVQNEPPVYLPPPVTFSSFSVAINSFQDVLIPAHNDPEGTPVIVIVTDAAAVPVNFILAGDYSKVTFSPLAFNEVGSHLITIALEDQ